MAEVFAIREALFWVLLNQFDIVLVETDCLQVQNALLRKQSNLSEFGTIF